MQINKEELKKEAMKAASPEEIMALVRSAGAEITEEEAKQLFEKAQVQKEDKELSLDELEAVGGGSRDWASRGCRATVEDKSWCWSNDACYYNEVVYVNFNASEKCPAYPGRHHYDQTETEFITDIHMRAKMVCRYCGNSYMTEWDRVIFK